MRQAASRLWANSSTAGPSLSASRLMWSGAMVVKPPESAYCSRMRRPAPGHQHPVEYVGRFIDRGRDGMRCEGSEPVRDMGVSLEARFAAKAGVDEAGLVLKEFLLEASGEWPGFPGEGSDPSRFSSGSHGPAAPASRWSLGPPPSVAGPLDPAGLVAATGGVGVVLQGHSISRKALSLPAA